MTYHDGNPAAPAGWYADPSGSGQERWWDGRNWAEERHAAPSGFSGASAPPRAPEGTPVYTPFIWAIATLPVISVLALATVDMRAVAAAAMDPNAVPPGAATSSLSWILFAAAIVLAYFDYRTLRSRGFALPFHWAWTLLGGGVYVIGRSVIARRRAGSGLGPIWAWAAVAAFGLVVAAIKVNDAMSVMVPAMNGLG